MPFKSLKISVTDNACMVAVESVELSYMQIYLNSTTLLNMPIYDGGAVCSLSTDGNAVEATGGNKRFKWLRPEQC